MGKRGRWERTRPPRKGPHRRLNQARNASMWRTIARRVLLPCAAVAIAVTIEVLLETKLNEPVLTLSLAAVVICVIYGGLAAGILATFLSIAFMDLISLAPGTSIRVAAIDDAMQLLIFLIVALL